MKDFNIGIWLSKVTISVSAWLGVSESVLAVLLMFDKISDDKAEALRGLFVAIAAVAAAYASKVDLEGFQSQVGEKE